jgi:hypothetical protein
MSGGRKNNIYRTILVLAAVALLAAAAVAQDISVKVTRLAGPVEVRMAKQTAWTKADLGQVLVAGDTLRTLKGGKVQLLFPGNTIVLIKENSVLSVKELQDDGGGKVKTLVGGFLFNIQKALSPGSTFEVETPSALAVVRGTQFGTDVDPDGTSHFTGYADIVEVTAEGVTKMLGPGQTIDVSPGGAPGDPADTDSTWDDAAGDADISDDDTALTSAGEYNSMLNTLCNRFRLLASRMEGFYNEYVGYEAQGDGARVDFVFYNVQPIMDETGQLDGELASILEQLAGDPYLNWVVAGTDPLMGTGDEGAALQEYIDCARTNSDQIHEWYNAMLGYILGAGEDPEDLLDELSGMIETRDPARDLRYGIFDTDGDGIPDLVEYELTGDAEYGDSLITLIEPDDGAEFNYPEDDDIFFEFEAMGEEYFDSFELHVSAEGRTMVRRFVGTSMDISIGEFIGAPGSPFAGIFDGQDDVEFTWFVRGNFNWESFYEEHSSDDHYGGDNHGHVESYRGPASLMRGVSSVLAIDSETRTFALTYPSSEMIEVNLVPIGAGSVEAGQMMRMRVELEDALTLASWEIIVNYDPSLTEFHMGTRAGLTVGQTLFFGDSGHGQLTISGEVSHTGEVINGSGPFCELEFMALEEGYALFSLGDINFYGPGGQRIEAIPGSDAEFEITPFQEMGV